MDTLLKVESIFLTYGNRLILNDVNIKVKQGTIHGFLGPNGAGKSSTMKIICGITKPDSGEIYFEGRRVKPTEIGFMIEDPILYEELTVKEFLIFIANLRNVSKPKYTVDKILEKLHLQKVSSRLILNLSTGYRQRVALAQAIIHDPKILILDEPTNGLDPQATIELREVIKELKKNHTILISSHLLHEMSLLCDELTLISGGKIVGSGTQEELTSNIQNYSEIVVKTLNSNNEFEKILLEKDYISGVKKLNETSFLIQSTNKEEIRDKIVGIAYEKNVGLIEIVKKELELEDIFLRIMGKND